MASRSVFFLAIIRGRREFMLSLTCRQGDFAEDRSGLGIRTEADRNKLTCNVAVRSLYTKAAVRPHPIERTSL